MSSVEPVEVAVLGLDRAGSGLDPASLGGWLAEVVGALCPDAVSFAARFVGDVEMRSFQSRYRGLDRTTDVLSFPGEPTPEGRHLGDVVISIDTARQQAAAAGVDLDQEVRELLLHGVLHCLGYDHDVDRGEMDRLELELRRRFVPARVGARAGR